MGTSKFNGCESDCWAPAQMVEIPNLEVWRVAGLVTGFQFQGTRVASDLVEAT